MTQIDDNTQKEGQNLPRAKESFSERFLAKKGKRWLFLYTLQVHVLAIFSIVVVFALQSYNTVQAAIIDAIGINIDIVLIIIVIWGVWLTYAIALLIRAIYKVRKNVEITPRRFNRVFPSFTTILFGGICVGVNFIGNSAITVSYRILAFVGLLLLAEVIMALIALAGPFFLCINRTLAQIKKTPITGIARNKKYLGIALGLSLYLFMMWIPCFAVPSNVLPGDLPAKPKFIAHRAGGFIGPENTIEGAIAMRPYGVVGMEIDIRMSWDGVPFLLHDDTLTRTTNVAAVFPARAGDRAETFNMSELQQLDAGSKFLAEPNGFCARQYVNESTLASFPGAKIATLADIISNCTAWGWLIDANIKGTSEDHPFASTFESTVLTMLNSSGLPIVFLGGHLDQTAPKIRHVTDDYEGNLADLEGQGYDVVMVDDLRAPDIVIRRIPAAGLSMYMQFIDDPITFSQVWCLGVTYIMTDTPYFFQGMTAPLWYLPEIGWTIITIAIMALLAISLILASSRKNKH